MKKVLFTLVLFAFVIGTFTSCFNNNTPKSVVKNYLENIKAKKFDKAIEAFYFEEEIDKTELDALVSKMKEGYEETGGIKKYEIISETIEEDTPEAATVIVKTYYGEETEVDEETYQLIKNSKGEWKIDLSSGK